MARPEFNPDKETAFIKAVIDGLISDLTKGVIATDFNSRSERNAFLKETAKIITIYGKEFEEKLLSQLGKDWDEEIQDSIFEAKGVTGFVRFPNKKDLEFIFSLERLVAQTKTDIEGLFSNSINTLKKNLNYYDQKIRQDVLAEIARGGTSGSSLKDISAKIQQEFIKNGITGFES